MTEKDNKKIDGPRAQVPSQPQTQSQPTQPQPQQQTQPQAQTQVAQQPQAQMQGQNTIVTPPQKQGCFNLRNCCLACLSVFIVFIIAILVLLALSGLVRIPLLSPLLYGNGPKPSRVVALQTVDDKYIENQFKAASDGNQSQVIFSENVLSYFINTFANKENNILVPPDRQTTGSQIAIENNYAELFYKPLSPKTTLTVKIIPSGNGYKAQKIKIGKLRVPVFAANLLFSQYLNFDTMSQTSGIKSVKLEKGRIIINIDPTFFKNPNQEAPIPFAPQ